MRSHVLPSESIPVSTRRTALYRLSAPQAPSTLSGLLARPVYHTSLHAHDFVGPVPNVHSLGSNLPLTVFTVHVKSLFAVAPSLFLWTPPLPPGPPPPPPMWSLSALASAMRAECCNVELGTLSPIKHPLPLPTYTPHPQHIPHTHTTTTKCFKPEVPIGKPAPPIPALRHPPPFPPMTSTHKQVTVHTIGHQLYYTIPN